MVGDDQKGKDRRDNGRFDGYRVNCELVPCLPARIVTACLTDPRRVPYLLMWRHPHKGVLMEVVRLASAYPEHDRVKTDWAKVKRGDGSKVSIRLSKTANKPTLICNSCQKPHIALYAWEINERDRNVSRAEWPCRACAGLSYASEGRALFIPPVFRVLKPFRRLLRRPEPWEPLVFASPRAAVDAGLAGSIAAEGGSRIGRKR